MRWDADLIADTVYEYVSAYNISIVRSLLNTTSLIAENPVLDTGILAPMLIKLKVIFSRALDTLVNGTKGNKSVFSARPVFVAGIKEYRRTVIAALRHQSQRVWFRWLYMVFSQYMWVNEWERIHAIADRRT